MRGKTLALRGDAAAGEVLAREAVEIAEQTDALNQRAKVLLDLAEVLRRSGDPEGSAIAEAAIEIYEQKGNEVAAATARTSLVAAAT